MRTARYLSSRSVRGYPYLAVCLLVEYERRDGVKVWRPVGPLARPGSHGVPGTWARAGTARARELREMYADSPRPWEVVQ